ncbi:MAG: hypothetical protein JWM27_1611 [Gemmatimonadetes bacterium]|nr:hypothetical protein [Gemmatimonadota bacterium]
MDRAKRNAHASPVSAHPGQRTLSPAPAAVALEPSISAAGVLRRARSGALTAGDVLHLQRTLGNRAVGRLLAARHAEPRLTSPAGSGVLQRLVAATYYGGAAGPVMATATITPADLGTGTAASVANGFVAGHMGNGHPYHHERGHLIGKQLGGDGADGQNLVGLSDGTNAPLMADIEGHVRDLIAAAGVGASVYLEVTVDYSATHYNGPAAAPYVAGMVGSIEVTIFDTAGGTALYTQRYPNGVVKNHAAAGCC